MKKNYCPIEAIKIHIDEDANIATTVPSSCWQYVTNKVGEDYHCVTDNDEKLLTWEDDHPTGTGGYVVEC